MVRKSRFLKQSSVPPSSRGSYSSDYTSSRSLRATSAAPSRDYRAGSAAPIRASSMAPSSSLSYRSTGRASSMAPASSMSYRSTGRASSIGPDRYASAASYRASSCTPYRSSSVAPMGSSSTMFYSRPILRASSVAPYSTSYRSGRASSLPPKSVSFRSTPLLIKASVPSRIDTSIPTRQFGTRLGVQKMETTVKPAIYDEYYGTTYVPSGGRDSWSAYRISDETLDDNDDLVYQSAKKDYEVMKKVNKQVQQVNKSVLYRHAPVQQSGVYRVPAPAAKVSYSTVNDSSDLLRPKNKSIANESIELARPATFTNLKDRLREARVSMDRSRGSLNKHNSDSDMRAINAEVNAIRNAREMRAQSLEPDFSQAIEDRKATSNLRKRIRSKVRSSKCGVTFK